MPEHLACASRLLLSLISSQLVQSAAHWSDTRATHRSSEPLTGAIAIIETGFCVPWEFRVNGPICQLRTEISRNSLGKRRLYTVH